MSYVGIDCYVGTPWLSGDNGSGRLIQAYYKSPPRSGGYLCSDSVYVEQLMAAETQYDLINYI